MTNKLNLYLVQDSDAPMHVLARNFGDAVERWERQVRHDNSMAPDDPIEPPMGVHFVAEASEVLLPINSLASVIQEIDQIGIGNRNVILVAAERERQRMQWSEEHDDEHEHGELAIESAYVAAATVFGDDVWIESPNDGKYRGAWKLLPKFPEKRQRLAIAAALLIAEMDRLDRVEQEKAGRTSEP